MSSRSSVEVSLSHNAMKVLERRYLKRDEEGHVTETPADLFRRVAKNVASVEVNYGSSAQAERSEREFYRMMASLEFMPNSPTLMNAGRQLQQLSACFVLPVDDSIDSIFDAVKNTALIHKSGGGTGFSFSRVRPKSDSVLSTKGVSSGPISFMEVFNVATETIKQGGTRRGANMGILRVDHPDILDFVTAKEDNTKLTNFNLSVAATDAFMTAVDDGSDYELTNPRTGKPERKQNARRVFDLIVEKAWQNGEPGLVFIDRVNRDNPTPALGQIESTNPCGEQPLLPYESCNLGSVNLARMVSNGQIDFDKLGALVHSAVRFLDDVIDANRYPLPDIDKMSKGNRKIGLGVMGFADMLIQLGVAYNSPRAVSVAEDVMSFIQAESRKASIALAEERGPFPNFVGSIYDRPGQPPVRNATTTTIAPTGTISIIAGCSGGIEPLFALCFSRNVMDNDELVEANPHFEQIARSRGFYSQDLMKTIAKVGGLDGLAEVPDDLRELFVTAHDITPECHIAIQAAFQKYTDNAVSKTINFPASASKEDVRTAFVLAYRSGCKGVTIYRDGSRESQVLTKPKLDRQEAAMREIVPRARPQVTVGRTEKMNTGCGNLYVTINEDEHGLFEVFSTMGKAGGCAAAQSEAISRLISLALRVGVKTDAITKNLRGIRCSQPAWQSGTLVLSCPDAVGQVMERYLKWKANGKEDNRVDHATDPLVHLMGACPDCGGALDHEEGCVVCHVCGYSKCA
jgi:ribonucleoside-diphosphate reductase alpha chain